MNCLLCNDIINCSLSYDVTCVYTTHSCTLLHAFIENVAEFKIVFTTSLEVCSGCFCFLNELDYVQIACKNLRQKLLRYLESNNQNKQFITSGEPLFQTNTKLILNDDKIGSTHVEPLHPKNFSSCKQFEAQDIVSKDRRHFECLACQHRFLSKHALTLHIRKQHSVIIPKSFSEIHESEDKSKVQDPPKVNLNTNLNCQVVESADTTTSTSKDEKCSETVNLIDLETAKGKNKQIPRKKRERKRQNSDVSKQHRCPECSKTWKTLGELKSHLLSHNSARPFICEFCGQAYKHKSALDVHVGMHNGINPFICTYCNKSFTQKGALQRHLPIHTGERPYQCDLCGKRFVHHTSFNIHQLSHSGQKLYKCNLCGLALLSGSHLKRHLRVHTGERNYPCSICGKRFAERYNLVSHQKLHENPGASKVIRGNHRCQICGTSYERRIKLEEHMTTEHQKLAETNTPLLEQLFVKSDTDSMWVSNTLSLKHDTF